MKLSTRVRYAVRAVLDLAINSGEGRVLLKDIARRQEVSVKYLENIFAFLRRDNIVSGVRGAKGGYTLARNASDISIFDVVNAMQGFVSPLGCVEDSCACNKTGKCVARDVWVEVSEAISDVLNRYTVADLMDKHNCVMPAE